MGNGWQSGLLTVSDSRADYGWLICIPAGIHWRGRTGSSLWSSKTLRPWSQGLDASQATSSIAVVEAPAGRSSPAEASLMMSGVVFLPVYPELPSQAFDVMVGLVNDCAARAAAESVAP